MAQAGYLVLIDLTGYTAFLAASGVDEGAGIVQSLLGTLLGQIERPLEVVEVEGDAVFAWAPEGSFRRGQTLLEVVEKLYCAFAATREQMQHNATCGCSGCSLIPRLDAKIIVHFGSFVLGRPAPGLPAKPVGPDVVLAHRLLKNSIEQATGVKAYAFVTHAAVDSLALGWLERQAPLHTETYEHIGEVSGRVHDLAPAWDAERAAKLTSVGTGDAWIRMSREVDSPVAVVWDILTTPEFKSLWRHANRVEVTDGPVGRGTEYRCYRGESVAIETIVDWLPFRRLTLDCEWSLGARVRMTVELSPGESGTALELRLGRPHAGSPAGTRFVRYAHGLRRRAIEDRCRSILDRLAAEAAARMAEPAPA